MIMAGYAYYAFVQIPDEMAVEETVDVVFIAISVEIW